MSSTQSDAEILEAYRNHGNEKLLADLYLRYRTMVIGVCMKYLKNEEDARDAMMDIYHSLGEKVHKHTIAYFKSWLYMVVKNHCLMILRRNKDIRHVDAEVVFGEPALMENPSSMHLTDKEVLEDEIGELEKAIDQLSEEQSVCVRKFYLEEKSYQEVAHETGYPLKKVKSYIQNGKRNLKNLLEHIRQDE
ncbi:MAG: sigma-70 family RNA polymerase sigma factor [Flavobacteriales bacterium]|nr:sigma-70 family RNA polymerase sigma factor [Flavobacteriales bacterium]